MRGLAVRPDRGVAALLVDERARDSVLVAIPRPEVQIIARIGAHVPGGADLYAFGVRDRVRRKTIRAGQRTVTARLHLGAAEAVLGAPASMLAGRIVPLEELWGAAATRPLLDELAALPAPAAAERLERAISERIPGPRRAGSALALAAAERLATARVTEVAEDLGVSERNLRRVFRDVVGVSPKAFAKLARFHRALHAARTERPATWARIAAQTGYYDQAHLIDEFRAIAGTTPRALVGELGGRSAKRERTDDGQAAEAG